MFETQDLLYVKDCLTVHTWRAREREPITGSGRSP